MGVDKSLISYHKIPQWEYLVQLLKPYVNRVYISVRSGQNIDYPYIIEDKESGLGPFGAILTALERYPDEAFLVLAVDMPNIKEVHIEQMLKERDTGFLATALQSKAKDYPEPLACIWEPETLVLLQDLYQKKIFKPLQVLKSIPLQTIEVQESVVQNINTVEALKRFQTNREK